MAKPTEKEIQNEIENTCAVVYDGQPSKWPGMSYEAGVEAALQWVLGSREEPPMSDD